VRGTYDEATEQFRIEVSVRNHRFGQLFGYYGTFTVAYPQVDTVPAAIRPVRETSWS